jgi:hypothetical protein
VFSVRYELRLKKHLSMFDFKLLRYQLLRDMYSKYPNIRMVWNCTSVARVGKGIFCGAASLQRHHLELYRGPYFPEGN